MTAMFDDLLAAQAEMPHLQKSAINPFYHNKYVPLESVLEAALPILNAHNFVLLQMPTALPGDGVTPGLETRLLHASGESVTSIMPLCMKDDGPQAQGSGITYARRYALLATLGLTADVDDDAEATRAPARAQAPPPARPQPRGGSEYVRGEQGAVQPKIPAPECSQGHGPMKLWPAGTSKNGKSVSSNYKCTNRNCDGGNGYPESIWADRWEDELSQRQAQSPTREELAEPLPFE